MPASGGDPVSTALRLSLASSNGHNDLDNKLVASSTRVLLSHIGYELSDSFQSTVLHNLKNKYIVLKSEASLKENGSATNVSNNHAKPFSNMKPNSDNVLPTPKVTLFPAERVQLGWRGTYPVGAGMINMGNTCYLNSTLQALFHVPALVNWLESDADHLAKCSSTTGSTQGECTICAMHKTLKASHSKSGGAMKPVSIYSKLKLICKHLMHGQQEDAHEFLRYLLESMEKAYLTRFKAKGLDSFSKETTPLNQIFGGYIRTEVVCLQCHAVSTTFQHFQDLLLDIRRASTLDDALAGYFCRERLDDDAYRCERCHKKVSATKKFCIEKPPLVLCLQFKRFSIMGGKINKHVSFSQRLDLTRFLYPQSPLKGQQPLTYRLSAMVTHMGSSLHCGHYTAVALTSSGHYYHFDDSSVRPISLHSALETNAYIIIYEMERNPHKVVPSCSTPGSSTVTSSLASLNSVDINGQRYGPSIRPIVPPLRPPDHKLTPAIVPVHNRSGSSMTPSVVCFNSPTVAKPTNRPAVSTIYKPNTSTSRLPPVKDRHTEHTNENGYSVKPANDDRYEWVEKTQETLMSANKEYGNGHCWNGSRNSTVVDHLTKLSHRGYGTNVSSWSGGRTHLDREVADERREERKRIHDNQYDEELDLGRVKKVKHHHDKDMEYRPKHNVFQEYHNFKHQWNNNNKSGSYHNSHYPTKMNYTNNNSYKSRNHNNYRYNNNNRHHNNGYGKRQQNNHYKRWQN